MGYINKYISILQSNVVSDAPNTVDGGAVRFDFIVRPRISPIPPSFEGQQDDTIPRSDPKVTRVLYRPQSSFQNDSEEPSGLYVREAEIRRSEV